MAVWRIVEHVTMTRTNPQNRANKHAPVTFVDVGLLCRPEPSDYEGLGKDRLT